MVLYVNQAARMDGNGTKEQPFRHINDAAKVAQPGDTVLVSPGVYREYVNPIHGGTEENRITYQSVEPLGAVITGAEVVTGWEPYQGNTWVKRIDNAFFGDYNPYVVEAYGDWYFAPSVRHTGAVYLNNRTMYETETLEECLAGQVYTPSWEPEYSVYKWFTQQEEGKTVLYANFQGKNPNEEYVEINVRRRCFFPEKTGVGYITFAGFTVCKAATTWAPPAAFQDGMVGPHWSKGWIIEDCDISQSKCCGISLGKYYDEENDHYFTYKHVKSPTQMERDAVCRGQYHGWLKEKVGSHIVRRCNIHHCEQTGIVGRMGCVFSTIEDNHIHHINNMQELGGAEISGIKLHAAIDVVIRRNHIHHSTMGVWLDWQAQGARISQNVMHHNERPSFCTWAEGGMASQDIFVEVGHGPTLIDNNILMSQVSLRIATEGVACVHNLMMGSFTAVGRGTDNEVNGKNQPRYTPYHIRHRTEVAGFMTILHGDNRFYNNIFVQAHPVKGGDVVNLIEGHEDSADRNESIVGTACWDGYPTYEEWIARFDMDVKRPNMGKLASAHFDHLPVWLDGNAYFQGATFSRHEASRFVDEKSAVKAELVEKDGKLYLDTNLPELLGDYSAVMVNSDRLGYAFEPEQRFEDRDGSAIVFDRDYFGDHRGMTVLPGPFASKEAAEKPVW